jgi:uncharacterized membrane protein YdbT with pleckstrin-like domain
MQTIYLHLPRRPISRVIDITPLPWWRRTARALLALLIFLVAIPLLWFVGAIFATVVLVGGAAMLGYTAFRYCDQPREGASPLR